MQRDNAEKQRQESFVWTRTTFHSEYNRFLAEYSLNPASRTKEARVCWNCLLATG